MKNSKKSFEEPAINKPYFRDKMRGQGTLIQLSILKTGQSSIGKFIVSL